MQYIPLKCGGCNKHYRLPLSASGFFRCRRCDLVMPIPESGTVVLDPPEDDEVIEIGYDPDSNQPIYFQTSDSSEELVAEPENVFGQHRKKSESVSPADLAGSSVGAGLILAGLFVLWLQVSTDPPEDRSMIAAGLGLGVALMGAIGFGFGMRSRTRVGLPASLMGGLAAAGLFAILLIPKEPESEVDQLAKNDATSIESLEPKSSRFSLEGVRKRNEEANRRKKNRSSAPKSEKRNRGPLSRIRGDIVAKKSSDNRASATDSVDEELASDTSPELDSDLNELDQNLKKIRQRQSSIPLAGDAEKISKLWQKSKIESRLKEADKIRNLIRSTTNDSAIDERTVEYLEMVERRLSNLEGFAKGEWIDLDFKYGAGDWLTSQNDVVNFQNENVAVVKSQPESGMAILTSPDAFYGSVTMDLEIQLDPPGKFAFFFCKDDDVSEIQPDQYVTVIDGSSGEATFGLYRSLDQDAIKLDAEHVLENISWQEPVPIRITCGYGYLQVFVEKKLLLEHFDSRIRAGTRLALANLGKGDSNVSVRNCKVKTLKGGTPPGKSEFVEEDIMYFNDVIGDFDEFGYAHYRLALARFGLGRMKEAIESAKEAIRLGVPQQRLAVILAMEKEMARQDSEACDLYLKSKSNQRSQPEGVQSRTEWQIDMHPIAQAYHAWLVVTNPDAGIRGRNIVPRLPENFHPLPWVAARIEAAIAAKGGNYAEAVAVMTEVKDDVPVQVKGQFNKQLEAYREKTPYLRELGRMPFYHDIRFRVEPWEVTYAK